MANEALQGRTGSALPARPVVCHLPTQVTLTRGPRRGGDGSDPRKKPRVGRKSPQDGLRSQERSRNRGNRGILQKPNCPQGISSDPAGNSLVVRDGVDPSTSGCSDRHSRLPLSAVTWDDAQQNDVRSWRCWSHVGHQIRGFCRLRSSPPPSALGRDSRQFRAATATRAFCMKGPVRQREGR